LNSSPGTVVTGLTAVRSVRGIREPVITIGAAGGAGSKGDMVAKAGALVVNATTDRHACQ